MTADLPRNPAYLTNALRQSGALTKGHVQEVTVVSDRAILISRIIRLRLIYDRAAPDAPDTVILKTGLPSFPEGVWNGGQREVAFYTQVAPKLSEGIVPRCFDAQFNGETQEWHLLLEDLTDSHVVPTQWPLPPTQTQCETILTARARLHAAWWDDPRLGTSVGQWPSSDQIKHRLEQHFPAFADYLGDNLPPERRALYDRFLEARPRLASRYHSHRNMTICQGDAHVWNCFLPRDGGSDVRLFDWDSWCLHVPAIDLAYMMAVHWYPDRRRAMEQPLLDHYHNVLLASGVTGYDRRALQDDYRWAVLGQMTVPIVQWATQKIPPVVWWNNMERILLAVDDLGCRDLLP